MLHDIIICILLLTLCIVTILKKNNTMNYKYITILLFCVFMYISHTYFINKYVNMERFSTEDETTDIISTNNEEEVKNIKNTEEENTVFNPSEYPMFYSESEESINSKSLGSIADNIMMQYMKNGYAGKETDTLSDIVSSLKTRLYYTIKNKIINTESKLLHYLLIDPDNSISMIQRDIYDILDFSQYYNTCIQKFILKNIITNINNFVIKKSDYTQELLKYIHRDYSNIYSKKIKLHTSFIYSESDSESESFDYTRIISESETEEEQQYIYTNNKKVPLCTDENMSKNSLIHKICVFFNNKENNSKYDILFDSLSIPPSLKNKYIHKLKTQLLYNPFYLLYFVNVPEFIITEFYNITINDLKKEIVKDNPKADFSFLNTVQSNDQDDIIESFTSKSELNGIDTCFTCINMLIKDFSMQDIVDFILSIFKIIRAYCIDKKYDYNKIVLEQIQNLYYAEFTDSTNYNTIDNKEIIDDVYEYVYTNNINNVSLFIIKKITEIRNNDVKSILLHPFYAFTNTYSPLYTDIRLNYECMNCLMEHDVFKPIYEGIFSNNKSFLEFIYTCKNAYINMQEDLLNKSADTICKNNIIYIKNNNFVINQWSNPNSTDPNIRGPAFPVLVKGSGIQFHNMDTVKHRIKYFKKYANYLDTVIDTGDILPNTKTDLIRLYDIGSYHFEFYDGHSPYNLNLIIVDNNESKIQYGKEGNKNINFDQMVSLVKDPCKGKKPKPPNIQYDKVMWSGKCDVKTCGKLGFNTKRDDNLKWNKEYAFTCVNKDKCESSKTFPIGPVNYNQNGIEGGNPFISLTDSSELLCENGSLLHIYRRNVGDNNWNKIDVLNSDFKPYNGLNTIFYDNNRDSDNRSYSILIDNVQNNKNQERPLFDTQFLQDDTDEVCKTIVKSDSYLNYLDTIVDTYNSQKTLQTYIPTTTPTI